MDNKDRELYEKIGRYYKSLPFTNRWMDKVDMYMGKLVEYEIVDTFAPIYDVKGSYVAHHEHNVFIMERGKIHLTKNVYY